MRVEKGGKQRHLGGVSGPALMVNNDTPGPDDHRHYQPSLWSPARKRLILFNYAALQSTGGGGEKWCWAQQREAEDGQGNVPRRSRWQGRRRWYIRTPLCGGRVRQGTTSLITIPRFVGGRKSHSFPELVVIVHESREGKGLINKPEQDAAAATRPAAASITPPYVTSREASGAAAAPGWEIFRVTQVDNAGLCGANTALSRLFARGSARCQVEGGSLSLRGSKL